MPLFDLNLQDLRGYQSKVVEPSDFEQFWLGTLAESRSLSNPPVFNAVDTGLDLFIVFDVTFSGFGGHPIKAWMIIPKHATKPLPCVVKFIGYGGGRAFPHGHAWARKQLVQRRHS